MKKNVVTMVLAVLSVFSMTFAATYSGGAGTLASPYIINTPADMVTLSQTPADWGSQFRVDASISLAAQSIASIGSFATPFSGTFDGNSKTISNYTNTAVLNSDWIAGLFGYNTGTVKNLTVTGSIAPQEQFPALGSGWIAGIVAVNDGTISNCTFGASGSIIVSSNGDSFNNVAIGGIAAENAGTVSGSKFLGSITGSVYNVYVGGIAGINMGAITSCDYAGSANINIGFADNSTVVNPFTAVGGIVGYIASGAISDCSTSALAMVKSAVDVTYIGGVAGMNSGTISDTQSYASVMATANSGNVTVGGFCGINQNGVITESFAKAPVTSGRYGTAGGFVGWNNNATVAQSYYMGTVTGGLYNYIGLFTGSNSGAAINNCFANGSVVLPINLVNTYFGGFAGVNDNAATIFNSYVVDKYAKGALSNPQALIAGGVGYRPVDTGAITTSIFNQTTSGLTSGVGNGSAVGVVAKTTANMKIQSEFTGWDFNNVWMMSQPASEFEGYPIFGWQALDSLTINYVVGWNWISFNVLPANATLAAVFDNYPAQDFDAVTAADGKSATFFGGQWYGTLASAQIQPGQKYRLKSASSGSFTVEGSYVDEGTPINLVAGWNWLGYCPATALPIGQALTNLVANNSDVVTSSDGKNATYYDGIWYGTLTTLEPGKGYLIKVGTTQVFSYGTLNLLGEVVDAPPADWISPNPSNPMTIYATVTLDGNPIGNTAGSMLSAWDGSVIAGVTNMVTGPFGAYFQLVVMSETIPVNGMTLKLYDAATDTVYDINETFDFTVINSEIGSFFSPEPFTASSAVAGAPDLAVTSTVADPTIVSAGGSVDVTVSVQNVGNETSDATTVQIFFSENDAVDWDTLASIESFSLASLIAGGTDSDAASVAMPAIDGTYYIRAKVVAVADETETANNWGEIQTVTVQTIIPTFTVTFIAGDNGTITAGDAVQTVNSGSSAVAPTITANTGWVFDGWDVPFTNVTGDLTVTAQYIPATFTVTFVAAPNGTITDGDAVQTIVYGGDAIAPTATGNAGWVFDEWDTDFTNVTSDLTVTAIYVPQTFTVTFDAGTNGVIASGDAVQTITYGNAAIAPTITPNIGWVFDEWDSDFTNVTSDLTVTALYVPQTFTVTFDAATNGVITGGTAVQTVNYGTAAVEPTVTPNFGWAFTGWDVPFTNVTSDVTVTAQYIAQTYTVNFGLGDHGVLISGDLQQTIVEGENASAPVIMPEYGWKLVGWLPDLTNVTGDITPEAQYEQIDLEAITCSAADLNADGIVDQIDLQMLADNWLEYGEGLAGDIEGNSWVNMWDYAKLNDCWLYRELVHQTIALVQGWNWISFNVLPEVPSIANTLAGYTATDMDVMIAPDGKNATYYSGTWYGTLANEQIKPGLKYRLKSAAGGAIDIEGLYVDEATQIQLVQGWNWLGYSLQTEQPIAVALDRLTLTNSDVVFNPNGESATYYNGVWYGTLETLKPGVGYMLKVNQAQVFSYSEGVPSGEIMAADGSFNGEIVLAGSPLNAPPASWVAPVPSNPMTIYATVTLNGNPIGVSAGSMLSAWDGGSIAGVTDVVVGPFGAYFQLVVMSVTVPNAGMTLKLYDAATDTVYNINETFDFTVINGEIGSFLAPQPFTAAVLAAGPNLTVTNTVVNPIAVVAGGPFDVTVTVDNIGDALSSATTVDVYTSTDPAVDWTTLAPVGSFPVTALAAGATFGDGINNVVTLAMGAADVYVRAVVNTVAGETNLADNWGAMQNVVLSIAPGVAAWYELNTNVPATTWTIAGTDFVSGPTNTMSASGISSSPTDVSGFTNVTFDVATDCANGSFLIFGITDAAGKYTVVNYWSGLTPRRTVAPIDLTPYKAAGNDIIFHWSYSKGRHTVGADTVWVWDFQLN